MTFISLLRQPSAIIPLGMSFAAFLHQVRILLKLPYNQPFEFDLTDFQVELGTVPTAFEYNATLSFGERLSVLWTKAKTHTCCYERYPNHSSHFHILEEWNYD